MIRTGVGYDSHRFAPGGPLVLGGIRIESDVHLHGHSDGDAIAHAITDAILGAAAMGDIGSMYPDTQPQYKNADSLELLAGARSLIWYAGYAVQQVDVVVIAEAPKIAPHREAMAKALATALDISHEDVSIKGKTNEGMGFVGRGEGIACIATATIVRR